MLNIELFKLAKKAEVKKPGLKKRKVVGQKPPLKLKEIWAIRMHLQLTGRLRELALFNLAIDSKLRACDLVKLRVQDVCSSDQAVSRAIVMQHRTKRPVQFAPTRNTTNVMILSWL
jgi:hypothetical protein